MIPWIHSEFIVACSNRVTKVCGYGVVVELKRAAPGRRRDDMSSYCLADSVYCYSASFVPVRKPGGGTTRRRGYDPEFQDRLGVCNTLAMEVVMHSK